MFVKAGSVQLLSLPLKLRGLECPYCSSFPRFISAQTLQRPLLLRAPAVVAGLSTAVILRRVILLLRSVIVVWCFALVKSKGYGMKAAYI